MDKRINIFKLLKNENKLTKVLVYVATESESDPYEHTKNLNYQQPVAIEALVRDVSPEALVWKYFGQIPMGSKELICEKRHVNTIKAADRIKIGDNYYKTRKDDSRGFNIIERNDYLICVVELKIVNT